MVDRMLVPRDVTLLSGLLRPDWARRMAAVKATGVPTLDGPTDDPADDPAVVGDPPTPAADPPAPSDPQRDAPSQADLDKAYEKLRAAERERDDLKRKVQEHEDANASELEKAQRRVEELETAVTHATAALQQAHLLTGLAAHEKIGPQRAKAAVKLIEGVEYGDDGEPSNLEERIAALLTEHAALFVDTPPANPASPANPQSGRDRGNQKWTQDDALRLARDNPAKFNELLDKGEIPASVLSGT